MEMLLYLKICGLIIALLTLTGVQGQNLTLFPPENPPSGSKCCSFAFGEKFVVRGQADYSTASKPNEWQTIYITFEKEENGQGTPVDNFDISQGCSPNLPNAAYCESSSGSVYNFVWNGTASGFLSRAKIRAAWTSTTLNTIYARQTLLAMYEAQDENSELSVNNGNINSLLKDCSFNVSIGNNLIRFCTGNTHTTANFTIKLNDSLSLPFTTKANCAEVSAPGASITGNVTFEYFKDECQCHGQFTCQVQIEESGTTLSPANITVTDDTTLPTTPGLGNQTNESTDKPVEGPSDRVIIIIVVCVVGGLLLIVACIVGYYVWKKDKCPCRACRRSRKNNEAEHFKKNPQGDGAASVEQFDTADVDPQKKIKKKDEHSENIQMQKPASKTTHNRSLPDKRKP